MLFEINVLLNFFNFLFDLLNYEFIIKGVLKYFKI